MIVVISQPMFFPWVGMFEQILLADVYVHYSDVQFSKGSFVNRVQVKTASGIKWLTVPLDGLTLGQRINEVLIDNDRDWRHQHIALLRQAYSGAPFCGEMLSVVEAIYRNTYATIDQLSEATIAAVCRYYGVDEKRRFLHVQELDIPGSGSQRVLDIVLALGGDIYVTGHGARRYLDHELFERYGVRIEYINYRKILYAQLHGEFTPYVSVLDLIANMGQEGKRAMQSRGVYWRSFLSNERDR